MDRSFGLALKDWRRRRRVSQLALSGEANVSARHIAFLETGRARPSRGMVLQLSEALAIPRAERNALLQAAGFAPAYKARDFADADVAALRQAMDWTLSRHDPYPAMALDRHWKSGGPQPHGRRPACAVRARRRRKPARRLRLRSSALDGDRECVRDGPAPCRAAAGGKRACRRRPGARCGGARHCGARAR